ncbi:MAG: hypothetical protein FWG12_01885 [Holophagaceae bacterium]|jgi:hypothetical protein|nr:hypothetical protein [Holophagaceae bacterium]
MKRSACLLLLIPLMACGMTKQQEVVDPQLGYRAVFPVTVYVYPGTSKEIQKSDAWRPTRTTESTPFGQIEWFTRISNFAGRSSQYFTVEVGTLPPGNQGGANLQEILATLKQWNSARFSGPTVELEGDRGPGFEYYHKKEKSGEIVNGIIVFRRGRIHHARASSDNPNDAQLANFLRNFRVDPD